MPKVSVIIPTHNRAQFICEAVESVLNQTFRDFELIVVDDGSTDNTREILSRYESRIHYIHQGQSGRSVARNRGIRLAQGEYVAFLDSDDVWMPDKLERQVPILEGDPDLGLIHGAVEVIDRNGTVVPDLTRFFQAGFARQSAQGQTYEQLVLHHAMYTSTVVVPYKIFEDVGLYDPALDPREDLDLYLRIAWKYRIGSVGDSPLARYRVERQDISSPPDLSDIYINLHKKHLNLISMSEEKTSTPRRKALRNTLIALARDYYTAKERNTAGSYLFQAFLTDPVHVLGEPAFVNLASRCLLPPFLVAWLKELRRAREVAASHY